jgi:hypothetical protein
MRGARLPVDLFSITDLNYVDEQDLVLYIDDDAEVAYSIFPKIAEHGTLQRLPDASWIL